MSVVDQSSEIPLPTNWTIRLTEDGKKVFVDHSNKITTWVDPRDSLVKPQSFADCIGNELPYGWEVAYDESIGQYFINHNEGTNQLEDPRLQWRMLQEAMILEYLKSAQENISAKENILKLKHERLTLAEEELMQLNRVLQRIHEKQQQQSQLNLMNGSKNSLASSSSSLSSKYDPDLLRAEIEIARQRVTKLKMEEHYARHDLRGKQKGVQTLARIKQKIVDKPDGYTLSEINVLENELVNLKQTLTATDGEKINLLRALARLREDIQGMEQKQLTHCTELPNALLPTEKATIASQTDVLEALNGNRVAMLARAKLRYNELKCVLDQLQEQLIALNERMLPSQLELDRDQINLIREKENLLRELKSVCQTDMPFDQQSKLKEKMHELEDDLRQALRLTREEMTQRFHMHQQKGNLEIQIRDTGLALANLEIQLRSLSASTLSTSSLSTNSSCGSLASGSAQDLLYMTNTAGEWSPHAASAELKDVHRRVEQLVYPQQNHHPDETILFLGPPLSQPPPPPYDATKSPPPANLAGLDPSSLMMRLSSVNGQDVARAHSNSNNPEILLRENSASSGTNTRSVSAAVSDESVAGDSGVYDGHQRQNVAHGLATAVPPIAQIMVTLDYASNVNKLLVTLEKARSVNLLWHSTTKNVTAIQIRGSLLPTAPGEEFTFRTEWSNEIEKPSFKKTFELNINLHRICNKILQLYVWGKRTGAPSVIVDSYSAAAADCLGGTQINLAEFNSQMMRSQWVNILSSQFIKLPPSEPPSLHLIDASEQSPHQEIHRRDATQWKNQQNTLASRHLNTLKEESSDESTVISSQTSTLTRNQNQTSTTIEESNLENQTETFLLPGQKNYLTDYRFRVTVNDDTTSDEDDIASEELVRVEPTSVSVETCDKETNTDPLLNVIAPSTVSKTASNANLLLRARRLNRSDSDSSVALQRKEPFRRNVVERRSLRWKRFAQTSGGQHRHANSAIDSQDISYRTRIEHRDQFRTSVDIELDLHSTKFKLERQMEEIEALKKMKSHLEHLKAGGQSELPKWLSENENLMRVLNASEETKVEISSLGNVSTTKETEEKRARHIVRKSAHHVQKLNEVKFQQPSTTNFCKKINSLMWTSPTVVSIINIDDDSTNDGSNSNIE